MTERHGTVAVDELRLAAELSGAADAVATPDVAEYALGLGDDALILSQQLGWWISRAPELEEDVALGNIALDLLGHARSLLHYAGSASGRSEDDLAFFRDESEFLSVWLVEQSNGDFAVTIVRQLLASVYFAHLYDRLRASSDPTLAAIAEKSRREIEYHVDHARQWVLRLAGGTDESRRRTVTAVTDLWPYLDELFVDHPLIDRLDGIAVRPSTLYAACIAELTATLGEAGLEVPNGPIAAGGGRQGRHFPTLGPLLAEMQVLARAHPGASW